MRKRIFILLLSLIIFTVIMSGVIKLHSFFIHIDIRDHNYNQLSMINRDCDSFSFDVFGDNKNSIMTFNTLIDKVNNDGANFAIDLGDMVYDGELNKYSFFVKQMENFKVPFLTVIGNHELKESGRDNYYRIFGRFYYSFNTKNSYFIIIDDANERNLDSWQMEWLKNELKRSQSYRYRFVFMHVPLFSPLKNGNHCLKDEKNAKELQRLFDEYKVTMIFASHIHGYYTGKWGNTPFIITGGAGAELMGIDRAHYFYHYIHVSVSSTGVSYRVVRLQTPKNEFFDRFFHDLQIYALAFFEIHFLDITLSLFVLALLLYIIFFKIKLTYKK